MEEQQKKDIEKKPIELDPKAKKDPNTIYFSRVRDVSLPTRGTAGSAGIDFYVPNDSCEYVIEAHCKAIFPSGIYADIPKGFILKAEDKSSIGLEKGLKYIGGVIDEDYQGEIHICVFNTGNEKVIIKPGEAIIQFLLMPVHIGGIVEKPLEILYTSQTERGTQGFGSTKKEIEKQIKNIRKKRKTLWNV